jgi:hypothetical protein
LPSIELNAQQSNNRSYKKPRVINTDVVEWFFGDARSMVGGSTNKLRAKAADAADRKAGAFNRGKHGVLGNNKSGEDTVFKREANRFNA